MSVTTRVQKARLVLDVLGTLAMVTASGVLVWAVVSARNQPQAPVSSPSRRPPTTATLPSKPISIDGAATVGKASAQIAVVEYSDFQCPYCAKFATETYPVVNKSYIETGRIKFVFKHLPLPIHPLATKAAEAAECGRIQGKFWPMHDALFAQPKALDSESLFASAERVGMDLGMFRQCVTSQAKDRVQQDFVEARSLGISGTPTFLFGRIEGESRVKIIRRESGAIPPQVFSGILDELLR